MTVRVLDRTPSGKTRSILDLADGVVLAGASNTVVCGAINIYAAVLGAIAAYPLQTGSPAVPGCECFP
jgi:hypothetical protein